MQLLRATAFVSGIAAFACFASADITLLFYNVTGNDPDAADTGEAQLAVTVDEHDGMARFTFTNTGTIESSITDVYFDDGTLLALATIVNGTGVHFEAGANPGELPGATNVVPPFVTSVGFSADSEPPATHNGVNPGEQVQILFTLQDGRTMDDVYADLFSGALRIGVHAQGFPGGFSEGFVNNIPAPSAAAAFAIGALAMRRRR